MSQKRDVWLCARVTLKDVDMPNQQFRIIANLRFFWRQDIVADGIDIEQASWVIDDDPYGVNLPVDSELIFEDYDNQELLRPVAFHYHPRSKTVEMELNVDATLTERMELELFPLDRQFMNIELDLRRAHWNWLTQCPNWVPEEHTTLMSARLSEAVAEYIILDPWVTMQPDVEDEVAVRLRLRVERYTQYFIGNVVIPMFLIVLACFSPYAIDTSDVSSRLSVTATLMIAAVAFRVVVAGMLPKVSYFTLVDYYLLIGFAMVGMFILENSIAGHLGGKTGKLVDEYVFGISGIFWIVFHVFVFWAMSGDSLKENWDAMDLQDEEGESEWIPMERQNLKIKYKDE